MAEFYTTTDKTRIRKRKPTRAAMTIQGLNNNPTAEKENTTEETTIRRTNAKNNTHEKPMGNVTDLGDINDKCVRQDANVPDATAQRSAVGQHGCT